MIIKKLKDIIREAKEDNFRVEERVQHLRSKVKFCQLHKFDEEVRISLVELNAIDMVAYRQGQIIKKLEKLTVRECEHVNGTVTNKDGFEVCSDCGKYGEDC